MKKLVYLIVPILVLSLAGCASTKSGKPKKKDIKGRVEALETRVDDLEQKQTGSVMIEEQVSITESAKSQSVSSGVTMSKREIQTALKNAGYYTGNIDGVMGPKTKQAVMDFQSAKGLKVDGVVGSQTSKALGKYLNE